MTPWLLFGGLLAVVGAFGILGYMLWQTAGFLDIKFEALSNRIEALETVHTDSEPGWCGHAGDCASCVKCDKIVCPKCRCGNDSGSGYDCISCALGGA